MLTPDKWLPFCYDQWVVRCPVNTEDETLWSLPALASDCSHCGWFRSLCSRFICQGFYFTIWFTRWLFIRGLTLLFDSSGVLFYSLIYQVVIHQGFDFTVWFIRGSVLQLDLPSGYSSGVWLYCLMHQGFCFTVRFTRWLFIRGTVLQLDFNRWLFSRCLTVLLNSSVVILLFIWQLFIRDLTLQFDSSRVLFYLLFIWTLFWLFDLSGGYSFELTHDGLKKQQHLFHLWHKTNKWIK